MIYSQFIFPDNLHPRRRGKARVVAQVALPLASGILLDPEAPDPELSNAAGLLISYPI